ncbi:MAG: hypothetical protein IIX04_05835, partial [Alistipes sp.]|nr:hypothetical protein [Alistipes sp.]
TSRTEDGYAIYAKMTGKASVSKYINFIIDGATAAQGSVYGATDQIKEVMTDGLDCTMYGYFVSISSGKYLNMMLCPIIPCTPCKTFSFHGASFYFHK